MNASYTTSASPSPWAPASPKFIHFGLISSISRADKSLGVNFRVLRHVKGEGGNLETGLTFERFPRCSYVLCNSIRACSNTSSPSAI